MYLITLFRKVIVIDIIMYLLTVDDSNHNGIYPVACFKHNKDQNGLE